MPGIIHYRANIDPTINQVCDIGLSKHVCFNREVNDIAYIGIVGSSLAGFPLNGASLPSTLVVANILVRHNAAPLDFPPHIPELCLTQRKAAAITNDEIRGNALFDSFQMIEKGHWNRYITVASCGLGHIGNLRTIVAKDTCTRNLDLRSVRIEINAVPLECQRLLAPQSCIKPQFDKRFQRINSFDRGK